MKYETKRYTIHKIEPDGDFNEGIAYEISLADGYIFSDGSSLAYAEDYEDLLSLIADIEKE